MKVTLENTTKIVEIVVNGVRVPARVWEGVTAKGVRCHAYITRIAVANEENAAEFEADLKEQRTPSAEVQAIDLRLVL